MQEREKKMLQFMLQIFLRYFLFKYEELDIFQQHKIMLFLRIQIVFWSLM